MQIIKVFWLVLILSACSGRTEKEVVITDLSKPFVKTLNATPGTYSLSYSIKGYVNDSCMLNGELIKTGKVDLWKDLGDWYEDVEVRVNYNPYKADSGRLVLTYYFYE